MKLIRLNKAQLNKPSFLNLKDKIMIGSNKDKCHFSQRNVKKKMLLFLFFYVEFIDKQKCFFFTFLPLFKNDIDNDNNTNLNNIQIPNQNKSKKKY